MDLISRMFTMIIMIHLRWINPKEWEASFRYEILLFIKNNLIQVFRYHQEQGILACVTDGVVSGLVVYFAFEKKVIFHQVFASGIVTCPDRITCPVWIHRGTLFTPLCTPPFI